MTTLTAHFDGKVLIPDDDLHERAVAWSLQLSETMLVTHPSLQLAQRKFIHGLPVVRG